MFCKYSNLPYGAMRRREADPYRDRQGKGALRPRSPIPSEEPDFSNMSLEQKNCFSWLGHASVFLRFHGKSILIDPIFNRRSSPVPFLGPRRFPGRLLTEKDLPQIDLILITHNHFDHLDRQTIGRLDSQTARYIVPSGVEKNLERFGVSREKILPLGWYEEWSADGLTIAAAPAQHNSVRTPFDYNRTLWCSYVLKDASTTIFDTGDGGYNTHFEEIHRRYGDMDLVIAECGQYGEPWHRTHMFPEESVAACLDLGAKLAIPVHWGAYVLSNHPWDDPPRRFARRAKELSCPYKIPILYEIVTL